MCVLYVLQPVCTTHAEGKGDINIKVMTFRKNYRSFKGRVGPGRAAGDKTRNDLYREDEWDGKRDPSVWKTLDGECVTL